VAGRTDKPELFIGLVGAVGAELDRVTAGIRAALAPYGYQTYAIRLAHLLHAFPRYAALPTKPVDEYIDSHMSAGNDFRKIAGDSGALASLAVSRVRSIRPTVANEHGSAFVFRSLKHPEEVRRLQNVYGDSFYLIAAFAPEESRRVHLAKRIARSRNSYPYDRHYDVTDCLMVRDQEELGLPYGQNTRDVFHRADLFLDLVDFEPAQIAICRFVDLLFGNTFHTATRAEFAMFHAQAAAFRSAELGRQVGAAISTQEGDIVAVGTNEVPKAGGGLYWAGDHPDNREFRRGSDSSDELKLALVAETIEHLKKAGWFSRSYARRDVEELVRKCIDPEAPVMPKESRIRNIIEYGRAVHAEMAALTDAARRGVSINDCRMYVTTFPCHLCARLIVAAGLKAVVYIEPYARSLAAELYPDSIRADGAVGDSSVIPFEPFMGVSPRQYMTLFKMGKRKDDEGRVIISNPATSRLRYYEFPTVYLEKEAKAVLNLAEKLKERGLSTRRMVWRPVCATIGSKKS